jgi:hypothetical protein
MTPPIRRLSRGLAALALVLGAAAARAQQPTSLTITDAETRDPPTLGRLHAIEDAAASSGWASVAPALHTAALQAFQQGRFISADAWFHLFEWSALFAEPENVCVSNWVAAMQAAKLNYPAVAGEYRPSDKPLGNSLSQPMQAWLVENPAFSEEFFSNINQLDYLPKALSILEGLHRRNPEKFAKYTSLCIAIALVYDVPPPPYWPHGQVSEQSLPRTLPNPAEPFEWLTTQDSQGRTYQRLTRLRAEELKFVVDFAAQVPELQWSLQNVRCPLDRFEEAYSMVKYRMDRFSDPSKFTWTGTPYTLQAILTEGGICVDQAYFATQAGKARGVPTLLFGGSGQDGRHAWFGYLDGAGKWRLDAGRYAEQRLVTGSAMDPQTWLQISDHELQFLSERFRALPTFMESRVHEEFARDFLEMGSADLAAKAARKAVNYERRNLDAWETLLAADARLGLSPAAQEGVMREAALAFTPRYPDLVILYENRVVRSLRGRGEMSLADYEERGIAERLKGDRADLAIMQAASILSRSIATQQVGDQIATYNAILSQFGHGAGTMFFDQIVVAFAEHLSQLHLKAQAREAVERAREALDVQPGTQISMDVEKLMGQLKD